MKSLDDPDMTRSPRRALHDLADFQDRGWQTGVFRSAAIAALAASIVVAPVALLRALTAWQLPYVVPLAFLIALEGICSTGQLGRPAWRDRRGLSFRLGELVMILLATRLSIWAFSTGWPGLDGLRVLLRNPGAYFDAQTVVVTGLITSVWLFAVSVSADFLDLAIQPDEVAAREFHGPGDSLSYLRVFRPVARGDIVTRFAMRWSWGGLPLVLLTGLSRLSINQDAQGVLRFGLQGMGLPRDVLAGLLCYFLAGLLLLSDARLAVLRGRWYGERVIVAPLLLQRWRGRGLWVIFVVSVVALVVPLGPVEPLASTLQWLVALLARIGIFLALLLSFLLSTLLYPLRWLFGLGENTRNPEMISMPLPIQAETTGQLLLPDWLNGALVWVAIGSVAGYLLLNYLRAHDLLHGPWAGGLATLRLWWRARRTRLEAAIQTRLRTLLAHVATGRLGARRGARAPAFQPRPRSARARVRYFYLRAAHRAAEQGHARPPHVTPTEYAGELEATWPEAKEDVQGLTAAFLAARYTSHELPSDKARDAQAMWRRLMRVLGKSAQDSPT